MTDKNKPQSKEQEIHIAICQYIRNKYPDVLFSSESGGIRVSIGLARKLKLMRNFVENAIQLNSLSFMDSANLNNTNFFFL
jgi:hypothetical protein